MEATKKGRTLRALWLHKRATKPSPGLHHVQKNYIILSALEPRLFQGLSIWTPYTDADLRQLEEACLTSPR
eukprot:7707682-Prorocentrum_lima.AAC.1